MSAIKIRSNQSKFPAKATRIPHLRNLLWYNSDTCIPIRSTMKTNSNSELNIHVALASDNNYFEGLLMTAWSIAKHCSKPRNLVIHVLDGGIVPENIDFLRQALSPFGCQLSFISLGIAQRRIASFKPYHGSIMPYARLLLPDLLPSVNQIVYSDVDILWIADIALLWENLDEKAIIHYTPHHPSTLNKLNQKEFNWFIQHGFKPDQTRYFCSGVIVLNLFKFREDNLNNKMLSIIKSDNGDVPQDDQTVLNAFMFDRSDVRELDYRWQIGTGNTMSVPDNLKFVLHFAADTPWKTIHANHHMLTDAILLWHKFHAKVRDITVWQSLRNCNSSLDIVAGRLLFLLSSSSRAIRFLIMFYMIVSGKKNNIPCINAFMVRSQNLRKVLRLCIV